MKEGKHLKDVNWNMTGAAFIYVFIIGGPTIIEKLFYLNKKKTVFLFEQNLKFGTISAPFSLFV